MMKKILVLATIITIALFSSVHAQSVKNMTTAEFKEQVWNFTKEKDWKFLGDKPVIIDLYADWCPPCKKLSPILDDIQKEYGDKIQIYKVNVDKEAELAQLFNANSIPLMVFIPKTGKPFLVSGLRPKADLVKIITENLDAKP